MESVGVIAFAFGQQQGDTPKAGPSNLAIGFTTEQIAQQLERTGHTVFVATQWEVAAANQLTEYRETRVVSEFRTTTHYVTTRQVLDEGLAYFKEKGVTKVVVVAHPLHRALIMALIRTQIWPVGTLRRSQTQRFKVWRWGKFPTIDHPATCSGGHETLSRSSCTSSVRWSSTNMAPRAKNPLGYLLLRGVEDTQEGIFMPRHLIKATLQLNHLLWLHDR